MLSSMSLIAAPAMFAAPSTHFHVPAHAAIIRRVEQHQIVAQIPVLPAIGAAAVTIGTAAIATKWNAKLDPVQNLIFIAMGEAEQPIYALDESDDGYAEALQASRIGMDKGMGQLPTTEVASIEDINLPSSSSTGANVRDIPTRIYYPPSADGDDPLPWILYCHGGGWVQGSIASHDAFCRRLCVESGFAVASVGYRLAPEAKWPAQVDDAFDALCALFTDQPGATQQLTRRPLDSARVAVAGDSAGGTIAAEVAVRARDAGLPPLRAQILLCPALDASCDTASFDENAAGPMLSANGMRWFWRQYLPAGEEASAARASPLRAEASRLSGLAPAHIVTAELDVLREEGEAYAARLAAAGVEAEAVRYDGVVHAFLVYAGTPFAKGDAALDDVVAVLRRRLLA